MNCKEEEHVLPFFRRHLDEAFAQRMEEHIKECSFCKKRLEHLKEIDRHLEEFFSKKKKTRKSRTERDFSI